MELDITRTKEFIRKQVKRKTVTHHGWRFTKYAKVYPYTNENIAAYISACDLSKYSNALTVLASGDHAFNLVDNGIYNIDTFDVNRLTDYYALGLKRAMFSKYSYEEYLEFEQILGHLYYPIDNISQTIIDLLPEMDEKYRKFWREIVDYNYAIQKDVVRPMNLFDMLCYFDYQEPAFNTFLKSKERYQEFQSKIKRANINFKECDVIGLADKFSGPYDVIMLSNILDYMKNKWGRKWDGKPLIDFIAKLYNITSEEAIIFLKYTFYYQNTRFRDSIIEEFKFCDGEEFSFERTKGRPIPYKDTIYLIRKKEE